MTKRTQSFRALGTRVKLTLFDPVPSGLLDSTQRLVMHYEDLLTVNRSQSEVMSINAAAGKHAVKVSAVTYDLIRVAVHVSQKYFGFDVAIGPLVQLWHIGFTDAKRPTDMAIAKCMNLIDPMQIELDDVTCSVFLKQPGMSLDLGGIGKGYIADAIKAFWAVNDTYRGIIDLGGNLLMVGSGPHSDGRWRVGVQDPDARRSQTLGLLTIDHGSIVTSGIYERFLEQDGHRYHHILDPLTGFPLITDLASVTVVSARSIDGEIFSSLGFYYGEAKIIPLLARHTDVGLIFTTQSNNVMITSNLRNKFTLTNANYRLQEVPVTVNTD